MYNGIGVQTPRGTGTNGYVQRNFAFIRHRKEKVEYKTEDDIAKLERTLQKKPNKEILEHQWKRSIELKCMELRDELEEQGYSESEIDQQVDSLRTKLRQETAQDVGGPGSWDTHHIAAATERKNEKFRQAFGISKDYVGGSAFDIGHKAMKAAQREEERLKRAGEKTQTYPLLPDLSEVDSPESEMEEDVNQKKKQKLSSSKKRRKKRSRKVSTFSSSSSASESSDSSSATSESEEERKPRRSPRKQSSRQKSISPVTKKTRHNKGSHRSPSSPSPEPSQRQKSKSSSRSFNSPPPPPQKSSRELRSPSPSSRSKPHSLRDQSVQSFFPSEQKERQYSPSPVTKKRHHQQSGSPMRSRRGRRSPERSKQYHHSRSPHAHGSSLYRRTSSSQSSSPSPRFKDQRKRMQGSSVSPVMKKFSPPRRHLRSRSSTASSLSPQPRRKMRDDYKDHRERRPASSPSLQDRHQSPNRRSRYHYSRSPPSRSHRKSRCYESSSSSESSPSPKRYRGTRHEDHARDSVSPRKPHSSRRGQGSSPRHHSRDGYYHRRGYSRSPERSRKHSPDRRRHHRRSSPPDWHSSRNRHHHTREQQYDSDSSVE